MGTKDGADPDELEQLRHRLRKLLQEDVAVLDGARVLPIEKGAEALEVLKQEVAETQMPRVLTFLNEREEQLALEVAGGRVLRGADGTTPQLVDAHARMEAFLSARRGDDQAAIMNVIRSFAAQRQSLRVQTAYLPGADSDDLTLGFDLGPLLAQAADKRGSNDPPNPPTVAALVRNSRTLATAGLCAINGRTTEEFGAPHVIARLSALAALEGDQAPADPNATAHFVIYAGPPEGGSSVLCATKGNALGLLCFEHDSLAAVLEAWKPFLQ